ncbi:MAG: hypothetical protein QOF01_2733 [Thermomicrobiales bacterium]|jgi:hypothetical protein|nr:hypothetical protein [Thermomicrobiales bacterium]MEA2596264.1 hypothetical protein [Thermomicrobiales bacterium]
MSMGASIVTYTVAPEHADELQRRVQDHLLPAARQTHGYRGFLLLDQGDGKRLALVLFDSVDDVGPAQLALTPVGRHTYALMSGPALGSVGTVVVGDGIFTEPAKP